MAKPKITRTITKKEWNKKHRDFKIMGRDGIPYIMAYDDKIGTHLVPVKIVDESVNEAKVSYNFSEDELKRVLKLLGRNASTEVKMIKAFEKAFGRKLTRDEMFESIEESLGAEIDLIMQNSNNLKDFIKKIFSDSDFKDMRNDKDFIKYLKAVYTENIEEGDGLWANIRAKRARGEKPAHGNSKAHKDAVKAGEKINKDEAIEEMDINDPIMMKLRAAQMKKNQQAAKKIDTEKQNKNAIKIKALKKKRAEVMRDMEQEAEPEGGKIANRYGKLLNRIDNDIIKLGGNPMSESVNEAYIVIYAKKKGEKPAQAAFSLRGSALSFERDLKKDGYITMVTQKKVKGVDESVEESMVSPKRGHNYYQLTKDFPIKYIKGKEGMGLEVPGVLIKNIDGYIDGKKGAYLIDYFGAMFYVDMKKKFAAPVYSLRDQDKFKRGSIEQVDMAPEHSDWKKYVKESVNEFKKLRNRRGDVDGLMVTHNGKEYQLVYSADFTMGGAIQPYGIVMPGDDVVSFLGKDRKAKSIWKQLKPKVDKFLKSNESVVNEANAQLNKKVKKYLDDYLRDEKKNSPEHQEAIMLIMRGALTDANFHSEARQLSKYFPKAKGKYIGTPMEDVIEDKGIQIAKWAKWDGHDIIDAFGFYTSMSIGGSFGAKFQSLKNESKKSVNEASDLDVYHKSYTHAIEAAEVYARKKGYEIDDDEKFTKVGMNSKRPSVGKTTRVSLELLKNGKPQRKMLHIQVYGMKNGYELNAYIN